MDKTKAKEKIAQSGVKYSRSQVCDLLGISYITLWRYVQKGFLPAHYYTHNNRPFFFGEDINAMINKWK